MNLLQEADVLREPVNRRRYDALKARWIEDGLNLAFVIANQVVVHDELSRPLLLYDYVSDLHENAFHLRVMTVELSGTLDSP